MMMGLKRSSTAHKTDTDTYLVIGALRRTQINVGSCNDAPQGACFAF